MITIDPESQSRRENYKLLTSCVIPRPVAFVTSMSEEGIVNAAPFSYFNIVSADPPMISISVQRNRGGVIKDTARNIQNLGSFVVHITDERNLDAINKTAASLPPDESEIDLTDLTTIASDKVTVPSIKESPLRLECILERMISLGGTEDSPSCDLIIGKVICFHIDEQVYVDGKIKNDVLNPISRLGGSDYSRLGEIFSLDRPK